MLSNDEEAQVAQISETILEAMICDIAMTIALGGHREVKLSRMICHRCGTLCRGKSQLPPPSAVISSNSSSSTLTAGTHPQQSNGNKSRSSTPQLGAENNGVQGNVTKNGTIYFPCLDCGRQIASNRYAPHLAGCLGLNGSQRRTARAATNDKSKARAGSEKSSMYVDNESDAGSDTSTPGSVAGSIGSGKGSRGPGRPSKAAGGSTKRSNSPVVKPGLAKKHKATSANPHPLQQSATFAESPSTPNFSPSVGQKTLSFSQTQSNASAAGGEGDEDAEGEDDVGEDDEYMGSDDDASGSEDDDPGQDIDDEYA